MRERKAIGIFLLFSVFILLTTCQLQFNKSAGNSLALRVIIPGSASGGGKSTPALASGAKSLVSGTSVTVTITTQAGAMWESSPVLPINGKTSIDCSFVLPPTGSYLASAQMLDGSGNIISEASAPFTVPPQTNPVILSVLSGQLVLTYSNDGGSTFTNVVTENGNVDFHTLQLYYRTIEFQVHNGDSSNTLYAFGSSPVTMTNNTGNFVINSQLPPTPVPPGGNSYFTLQLATTKGSEPWPETVTLRTSDTTNDPFTFSVTGHTN